MTLEKLIKIDCNLNRGHNRFCSHYSPYNIVSCEFFVDDGECYKTIGKQSVFPFVYIKKVKEV